VGWLVGRDRQADLDGGTGRTFRHKHGWCWNIEPVITVTGEVYDEIQLDGTYLADHWCLLAAIDGHTGTMIGIQWAGSENEAAWTALLSRFPAPRVVVTDGSGAIYAAIRACWGDKQRIQRCLVHVVRRVRRQTTLHPRTEAGQGILRLARALTKITTTDEAATWLSGLNAWYIEYQHLLKARTYAGTDGAVRPTYAKANSKWWWTHLRLRRAYYLLERLAKRGHLFTFLDPEFDGLNISSTTNRIEGAINAQIKALTLRHRGMTPAHQRRAIEWWAYLHSTKPATPADLIRPEHWQPAPPPALPDEPTPGDWGTATTAEEGLWDRKGWAGQSH
jgi:hypothetical protein